MKSVFAAAAAACTVSLVAGPASAATYSLTCDLRSIEDNVLYNNNAELRLNGYGSVTEQYRVDDVAKTVTLVSRTGTRTAPPENGSEVTAVNDPMQFYADVRSITPEQLVFCTDDQWRCQSNVIDQGTMESTVTVGLTVIDLASGRISTSRHQFTRKKDGSQSLQIAVKWEGACRKA